jgi:hypothetical protein
LVSAHIGLDLCSKIFWADFLEEAGVKVAGILELAELRT